MSLKDELVLMPYIDGTLYDIYKNAFLYVLI